MKNTLLYVDDEPINLQLFEIHMKKHFNVYTALSGPIALQHMTDHPEIDVVFSDMKMPHMDGLEFINEAKKIKANAQYYILSGYNLSPDINKALKDKTILGYFQKPFDIGKILRELQSNT
ncbi:response regulator [Carboxylicivirga sp. N1Y90]|uniref:response regulator n=1 Tax=Carboxylicivirga fragile TaxID=3417571 RepID=UPI003D34AF91|nr:response regulator [Marinilabiliaceae bacterium N1Y90]